MEKEKYEYMRSVENTVCGNGNVEKEEYVLKENGENGEYRVWKLKCGKMRSVDK